NGIGSIGISPAPASVISPLLLGKHVEGGAERTRRIGPHIAHRYAQPGRVMTPENRRSEDGDYDPADDAWRSVAEAYRAIRERVANGGPSAPAKVAGIMRA